MPLLAIAVFFKRGFPSGQKISKISLNNAGNEMQYLLHFVYTNVYNNAMENQQISGFQWDAGNREKCQKHGVAIDVIEGLFRRPVAILPDEGHSQTERRFKAVGKDEDDRAVFVIFTLRQYEGGTYIRPISARYMHAKEVIIYEKENPDI